MNLQMPALPCKVLRVDLFSIERVGDLHPNRSLLVRIALIIDIIAARCPRQILSVLCEGLVTFYVLNIGQIREVLQAVILFQVFQPVADKQRLLIAACICEDINRLILFGSVTVILCLSG